MEKKTVDYMVVTTQGDGSIVLTEAPRYDITAQQNRPLVLPSPCAPMLLELGWWTET